MVEDEIDQMAQDLDHQLKYQGLSLDMYLQYMQKDANEFREELREEASKKVETRVVLMSIGAKENIEVSDDEIEAELKQMADQYQMEVEKVREMLGSESITYFKKDIQLKKVIDLLYDKANVTKVAKKEEKEEEKAPESEEK